MRFGVRLLQKMCSRLFVQPTLRYATHHVRPPALADRTGVAASVAAAASAASVPTITEGDEFARWAADLRRRAPLAGNEVDLVVQGPHEVGRLALAAHRVREATIGGRQFIWEICRDGDHRIKRVAVWRWLELEQSTEGPSPTTTSTATTTSTTTAASASALWSRWGASSPATRA